MLQKKKPTAKSKTRSNKRKKLSFKSRLFSTKIIIFVLLFAGIGSYFIIQSFAANNLSLTSAHLDIANSLGAGQVKETTSASKSNQFVVQLGNFPGVTTAKAALINIGSRLDVGVYEACLISRSTTGTIAGKLQIVNYANSKPSTVISESSFSAPKNADYSKTVCANFTNYTTDALVAAVIRNTTDGGIIRIGSVQFKRLSNTPIDEIGDPTKNNGYRLGIATGYPYAKDNTRPDLFTKSYPDYVKKVADLGVKWIRTDAIINGTQPITVLDETMLVAKSKGIRLLVNFTYGDISKPDVLTTRMTQYMYHWASIGVLDTVGAYEMWNEPNNGGDTRFPFQDPQLYVNWLKKSYPILKQFSPKATVVLGGFSPGGGNDPCCNGNLTNPADYLNKVYSLNKNSSNGIFDAVAMHPYANSPINYPEGNNHHASGMRVPHYLRGVMNIYGDQAKQIWGTESGWLSCGSGEFTEEQRAVRLKNDLNDWFYGVHNSAGERVGYAAKSDWNTGPFMIFKLYKAGTGGTDDNHGLIYTNLVKCGGRSSGYEPPIVNGIKFYSATSQGAVPKN